MTAAVALRALLESLDDERDAVGQPARFSEATYEALHAARGVLTGREADGVALIEAERDRQRIDEGWTDDHDDDHGRGEMAIAAACYATHGTDAAVEYPDAPWDCLPGWPWSAGDWKPGTQVRNLVKAGALIAAEIDRVLRAGGGQ